MKRNTKNFSDDDYTADIPSLSLPKAALFLLSYRTPMMITELMEFPTMRGVNAYYICPRCGITLDREYQSYCDRCGQHLDWRRCNRAKVVKQGK